LAATLTERTGQKPERPPRVQCPAYADAGALERDLAVIAHSLQSHGSGKLANGRLRALQHAVAVFGFHLAALDLRQNSIVHERTVGELLARAGVHDDYAGADEATRVGVLARELATPRLLVSPFLQYGDETTSE